MALAVVCFVIATPLLLMMVMWATDQHPGSFTLDLALSDEFVIAPAPDGTANLLIDLPPMDTVQGHGNVAKVRVRSPDIPIIGKPVGSHDSWGSVITYDGTANQPWTPRVRLAVPVEESLAGGSFSLHVSAKVEYPAVGGTGFEDRTSTLNQELVVHVRTRSTNSWFSPQGLGISAFTVLFLTLGVLIYVKKARARSV
jgi:hypothetical protein